MDQIRQSVQEADDFVRRITQQEELARGAPPSDQYRYFPNENRAQRRERQRREAKVKA